MPWVLNRVKVDDYMRWREHFDRGKPFRESWGEKSEIVYRQADDPLSVVVLLEWADAESARKFSQLEELRKMRDEAGVKEISETLLLEKA